MAKLSKKSKISMIKKNNQTKTKLGKQGKLKTRRYKKKQAKKQQTFLNNTSKARTHLDKSQIFERKNKNMENNQAQEEVYEKKILKFIEEDAGKSFRLLLPVKTRIGSIEKRLISKDDTNEKDDKSDNEHKQNKEDNQEDISDMEIDTDIYNLEETDEPVSTVKLMAAREELLQSKRFKIGILSSGILENPEQKIGNLQLLLDMMDEKAFEIYITVRKLAMVSLLEVFKDILPSYSIHQISQERVKLKKETLTLQNYEGTLLRSYKGYLQRLEKMAKILIRKKGDQRVVKEREVNLGEIAISCMCELITIHPYFNFSDNIANYIIPFLDNKRNSVRERVAQCISQIFKEDKRSQLSLIIVRKLNQYVKSRKHSVHPEVIQVLQSLRLKDINLDKEKEDEIKQKTLMSHKQRILALSRREKKKSKKLEQVEKELLETKAEENKEARHKILTEITSIVFTIYFRILKQAPNSKLISACLEGLAKFAHCININFYQDLVSAIDKIIEDGNLGLREQLHCVQCIFAIFSGQGSALNIDVYRFYVHLYKNILNVHCGKTHAESKIMLKTLIMLLIHQRKRIAHSRLIAFVKRISLLTLQSQHNAALGILGIVKQVMQLDKASHILLDTDCAADGYYQAEIEEPDYCNAHCTALWELVALQRHYHSVVRELARNIAYEVPTNGEGSLSIEIAKLTPEELYTEYDPTGVAFKPAVPVPKTTTVKKGPINCSLSPKFEEYIGTTDVDKYLITDEHVDFYKDYKTKCNL